MPSKLSSLHVTLGDYQCHQRSSQKNTAFYRPKYLLAPDASDLASPFLVIPMAPSKRKLERPAVADSQFELSPLDTKRRPLSDVDGLTESVEEHFPYIAPSKGDLKTLDPSKPCVHMLACPGLSSRQRLMSLEHCTRAQYAWLENHYNPAVPAVSPMILQTRIYDKKVVKALAWWLSKYLYNEIINNDVVLAQTVAPLDSIVIQIQVAKVIVHILQYLASTPSTIFLSLWQISRLGVGTFGEKDLVNPLLFTFRHALHVLGDSSVVDFIVATFAIGMILADKSLNDATYKISSWEEASHIPRSYLNRLERAALLAIGYDIHASDTELLRWLSVLDNYHYQVMYSEAVTLGGAPDYSLVEKLLKNCLAVVTSYKYDGSSVLV